MRKLAIALTAVYWLAGCSQPPMVYDTAAVTISDANETMNACVKAINAKPEYTLLVPHTVIDNNPTISQMTDERLPTRQEATLYGQRADEVLQQCIPPVRQAIATYRPWLVNSYDVLVDSIRGVTVLTVERKITWAERLRRNQAAFAANRQEVAAIRQTRQAQIAQENAQAAQVQSQRAQNAAATLNALANYQAATRPTFPVYPLPQPTRIQPFSCIRNGPFVNCQ
jgi:hypothetical protein